MNRREFLNGATLAAGAELLGVRPLTAAAAEPRLETTRIRIIRSESTCVAPELVAEDLLRAEPLWAGIHYRSDIEAGLALGRSVAEIMIERAKTDGAQ